MHAFLFNRDHHEISELHFFGPPCTKRVVAALESLNPIPTTQLIRGKILPESSCYQLSEFLLGNEDALSLKTNKAGMAIKSIEFKMKDGVSQNIFSSHTSYVDRTCYSVNMDLAKTLICDLAESLCSPPSTAKEEEILLHLGHGLIWSVGTPNITDDQAKYIDSQLSRFGPYLGMVKLDDGNPIHWLVMVEQMVHNDVVINSEGFFYGVEPGLDEEDLLDRKGIAHDLCSSNREPTLIDYEELHAKLPRMNPPVSISQRGRLSLQRFRGKTKQSHRERLAIALLDHFRKEDTAGAVEFSTMLDDGIDEFELAPEKFTKYLLNLEHAEGKGKARFFIEVLGIAPDDWKFLADQIRRGVKTAPIFRAGKNQWGFTHGAFVMVRGKNEKTAVLETGWIVASGQPARFVTAYPHDGDVEEPLETVKLVVVDGTLAGHDKWEAVCKIAYKEGEAAAESFMPTPMRVEGYETIWEGECGFAWVHVPDGRHSIAKWLVKTDKGYKSRPGVKVLAETSYQSVERNRAWANAFAEVLKANGVECSVGWRLD